jgi:homoserine O-acetyltransferase
MTLRGARNIEDATARLRTAARRGNITAMLTRYSSEISSSARRFAPPVEIPRWAFKFRHALAAMALLGGAQSASAQRTGSRSPPRWFARVETTKGRFVLEVDRDWAPLGADHFWELIHAGFYDDSRFTRVVPNFIMQFGVAGDSAKNAKWSTVTIPDDSARGHSNVAGTFGFAMRGPNDRTTQLFISLVDNSRLDAQGFVPLGRVVEGVDVVKAIYSGYGENSGGGVRAGHQAPLMNGGNAYVDREYPKLDKLIRITVEERR